MNNKQHTSMMSGHQKRQKKRQTELINAANHPKQSKLSFVSVQNYNNGNNKHEIENINTEVSKNASTEIIKSVELRLSNNSNINIVQENVEATILSVIPSKEMNSNYDDGSIDITQEHINEIPDSLKNDFDFNINTTANVENVDGNDKTSSTGYFIPPINMPTNIKVSFVNSHPIQPTGPEICFDVSKVYYRYLENKHNKEVIQRKWLSYNVINNKMYCSICMAFSTNRSLNWITGILVNVKHIYKSVEVHEISNSHKLAVNAFITGSSSKSLDLYFNDQRKKDIETRRQILERIISIILVLAKQDLPFRDHRNENCYSMQNDFSQKGNFLEIVKLVAKFDPVLKNHIDEISKKSLKMKLSTDSKNIKGSRGRGSFNSYLSKNTFNKIIIIIGNLMKKKIAQEVIEAKIFSLEIDSTQDVAVMDQLSLCIRYVLKGEVQERFLKMIEVKSSTGIEQYLLVKENLDSLSIDLKNLVSESFDGASNMSGQYSGLQAQLKKDSPSSIFTHCHAHVLNLIISDATNCCISSQNLFVHCQKTAVFISRSYKRSNLWKTILQKKVGHEKLRKLKKIGETRWNSKDGALKAIFHSVYEENDKRERYICLLEVLHSIGYDNIADGETAAEARNLLDKWTQFDTILTSFLYLHVFSKATPVSKYLQTKCLDYLAAWNQIVTFQKEIKIISNDFDIIYEQAKKFSQFMEQRTKIFPNVFLETKLPEQRKRKIKKMSGELLDDEVVDNDPIKLYRVQVFRIIIDKLSMAIEDRFFKNKNIFQALTFFDPNRFIDINNKILTFDGENEIIFKNFCNTNGLQPNIIQEELINFSSSYESIAKSLEGEYACESELSDVSDENIDKQPNVESESPQKKLNTNSICKKCIPCVMKLLYKYNFHTSAFTNLYLVYKYILTLSCTQVHCERSFSKLKIIKTRLRSSLSQELLEPLLLISIESDKIPDVQEIITCYANSSLELQKLLLY